MGKLINWINSNLSLQDEYFRIFHRDLSNGKFLCPNPLHKHSSNTPSCKVYGNVFKCFGQCNRVFGVYDLLKWYNPERIEEIKSTVVVTETPVKEKFSIKKIKVDRSDPLKKILYDITGIWLSS